MPTTQRREAGIITRRANRLGSGSSQPDHAPGASEHGDVSRVLLTGDGADHRDEAGQPAATRRLRGLRDSLAISSSCNRM